jgi:hypothetical protein
MKKRKIKYKHDKGIFIFVYINFIHNASIIVLLSLCNINWNFLLFWFAYLCAYDLIWYKKYYIKIVQYIKKINLFIKIFEFTFDYLICVVMDIVWVPCYFVVTFLCLIILFLCAVFKEWIGVVIISLFDWKVVDVDLVMLLSFFGLPLFFEGSSIVLFLFDTTVLAFIFWICNFVLIYHYLINDQRVWLLLFALDFTCDYNSSNKRIEELSNWRSNLFVFYNILFIKKN